MRRKFFWICILLAGCSLERAEEHGQECDLNTDESGFCRVDQYCKVDDTCEKNKTCECTRAGASCPEASEHTNGFGYCLPDYVCRDEACIEVEEKCGEGMHLSNDDTCVEDTIYECGPSARVEDCTQLDGWNTGECIQKSCVAKSCKEGYYLNQGKCEQNSSQNCGEHGKKCVFENGTGECQEGVCVLTACDDGYHFYDGKCEQDSIENCGSHGNKCLFAYGEGTCKDGKCVMTKCDAGYHIYEEEGVCEIDSVENCGEHEKACGDNTTCTNRTCTCKSGATTYDGKCVYLGSDESNCGACGKRCLDSQLCIAEMCQSPRFCKTSSDCSGDGKCCKISNMDICTNSVELPEGKLYPCVS